MEKYEIKMCGYKRIWGIIYDDTDYSYHIIDLDKDVVRWESYKYPEDIIAEFEHLYQKGIIDGYRKIN